METEQLFGSTLQGEPLSTDYRIVFESAPSPHILLTPDFKIVTANDAYCKASMTTREQLAGHNVFEIFPDNPNDPQATGGHDLLASLTRVRDTGAKDITVMQYDIRRPASEGGEFEQRYWSLVSAPVFGDEGRLVYILIHVEDMTAFTRLQKRDVEQNRLTEELQGRTVMMKAEIFRRAQELQQANEQLRETARRLDVECQRLDEIFLRSPAFIAVLRGSTHRFEFVNDAYRALIGNRDFLDKPVREIVPEAEGQGFFELLDRVYTTGETFTGKQMRLFIERNGMPTETFLDFIYQPLVEADGSISGVYVHGVDVTDLKRAADERADLLGREQEARAKAEEANALKLQFMGMVSHELRTPLASIKGFISTVLATDVQWADDQRDEFLTIADAEADKMTELIDQLLDATQLHAGTLRITRIPNSVADVIARTLAQLTQMTITHPLKLDITESLPLILVDDQRIAQVLTNLVGNAVKFSPEHASIEITVHSAGKYVRIDVSDHGEGIPVQDRPHVFEAFRQLPNRANGKGVGLGLAICKGIVQAHGGEIWIEDNRPQGTIVSFTLPYAAQDMT